MNIFLVDVLQQHCICGEKKRSQGVVEIHKGKVQRKSTMKLINWKQTLSSLAYSWDCVYLNNALSTADHREQISTKYF